MSAADFIDTTSPEALAAAAGSLDVLLDTTPVQRDGEWGGGEEKWKTRMIKRVDGGETVTKQRERAGHEGRIEGREA